MLKVAKQTIKKYLILISGSDYFYDFYFFLNNYKIQRKIDHNLGKIRLFSKEYSNLQNILKVRLHIKDVLNLQHQLNLR